MRRLHVADHVHAVETAIQEHQTHCDPDRSGLPQKALNDVFHRLALGHRGQGNGVPLPLADDVGRGIGMEVTGAALEIVGDACSRSQEMQNVLRQEDYCPREGFGKPYRFPRSSRPLDRRLPVQGEYVPRRSLLRASGRL